MHTDYPDKYILLGRRIAYYRRQAGMTQEALAEAIGRSVNFLAQVECAGVVRGVSLETLFRIADALNVTPAELIEGDGVIRTVNG